MLQPHTSPLQASVTYQTHVFLSAPYAGNEHIQQQRVHLVCALFRVQCVKLIALTVINTHYTQNVLNIVRVQYLSLLNLTAFTVVENSSSATCSFFRSSQMITRVCVWERVNVTIKIIAISSCFVSYLRVSVYVCVCLYCMHVCVSHGTTT